MKNEMHSNIQQIFGQNVRYYRLLKNLTQEKLAEQINRTEETVSKIERGVSIAKIEILVPLAKALDVTIDELFSLESSLPQKKETIICIQQMLTILHKQDIRVLQVLLAHIQNLEKIV